MAQDYREWTAEALSAPVQKLNLRNGRTGDCIVSFAAGYPADILKPLVLSLRAHSAAALLVATEPGAPMEALAQSSAFDLFPLRQSAGYRPYPAFARLAVLLAILRGLPEDTGRIILCDSRDVIFQGDPFAGFPEARIAFFAEDESGDGFSLSMPNGRWARLMLAPADLALLKASRSVVNAGVIMASRDAAIELCILKIRFGLEMREWCRQTTGLDNIATNVVAQSGRIAGTEVLANHRQVANVLRSTAMTIDDAGRILGPDGNASPIVHMYDRLPALAAHVRDLYGPSAAHQFDARRSVASKGSWLRDTRHYLHIARLFMSGA